MENNKEKNLNNEMILEYQFMFPLVQGFKCLLFFFFFFGNIPKNSIPKIAFWNCYN